MQRRALNFVTICGSFQKFPDVLAEDMKTFEGHGVTVLSPTSAEVAGYIEGFVSLVGDPVPRIDLVPETSVRRAMKTVEDGHMNAIQHSDAVWLMLPDGYCGPSTSCEIGWTRAHNVPVFYDGKYVRDVKEPIVKMYARPTKGIGDLVRNFDSLSVADPSVYSPRFLLPPRISRPPNSPFNTNVAVGPMIVDCSDKRYKSGQPRDILIVQTYKWGNMWSIVGGKLKRREKLPSAFQRVVADQTGLECFPEYDICVFDEIPDSGYCEPMAPRIFVDRVVKTSSRRVRLDHRAQDYEWVPPAVALRDFDLEPNARKTIELYMKHRCLYG